MKRIAILGSTGSIGTQTLEVIDEQSQFFQVELLTAGSNVDLLAKKAIKHKPNAVVIANEAKYEELSEALSSEDIKVYAGASALEEVVQMQTVDVVLTAMVGYAGLKPTIAAIKAKKHIALAKNAKIENIDFRHKFLALDKCTNLPASNVA